VRLDEIFSRPVPIAELRAEPELKDMELLRRGSRLSVQPVRPREFDVVLELAKRPAAAEPKGARGSKTAGKSSAAKAKIAAAAKTTGRQAAGSAKKSTAARRPR
jgi:hypothetical protein